MGKNLVNSFRVLGLLSVLFLSVSAFRIQTAKAVNVAIYIRADGGVDPPTAPIQRDGDLYTLTDNITSDAVAIVIQRNDMILDGAAFAVQGVQPDPGTWKGSGIYIMGRNNATIRNMQVKSFADGIVLEGSLNVKIYGAKMTDNYYGIRLITSSNENNIFGNNITANWGGGIRLLDSSNNNISENHISECNILLEDSTSNRIYENNIANGEIGLSWGSNDNSIFGNRVTNGIIGLFFSSHNNSIYRNCVSHDDGYCISLDDGSSHNDILENNITAVDHEGVFLDDGSSYNRIIGNNIISSYCSVRLDDYSSNNIILGNNLVNNSVGIISIYGSNNNIVYHNNFIGNTQQVYALDSSNVWDDGYPSGGNYWSDYKGPDTNSDGIGDTPYTINSDNRDNYPLMHPFGSIQNLNTSLVYLTIHSAINAPETLNGHTIFVRNGTYYENLFANKSVSLVGENREATIIDGNGTGTVISVMVDGVSVTNFAIRNSGSSLPWPRCGVNLINSNFSKIQGNILKSNLYGIYGEESSFNIISQNSLMTGDKGVYLVGGFGNIICHNQIEDNRIAGLQLDGSNNNTVEANTICNNYSPTSEYASGIWLHSSFNIIRENNLTRNYDGISLSWSQNNTICQNDISDNLHKGMILRESYDNSIFHNSFNNDANNVFDYSWLYSGAPSINNWNSSYPSGGNHWSDYVRQDVNNDGLGDSPYVIDGNNRDNYPLIGIFSDFNATSEYCIQTICNSSISDFWFNGTAINFNVSGENSATGFCRICIPTALMNGTYRVFVNETEILPSPLPLPCSNSTHSYLYFSYKLSTKEIVIIPEFPSFLALALFMIATLFTVIVYKRKHST